MSWKKNNRFDSSLEALTPEGVKFILSPAGLPVRTLAYGIDIVVQWLIILAVYIAFGLISNFQFGLWLFLLLMFLVEWFYHVICELAFKGRSLGKRMTGIRVVKANGAPVDPASSFIRNLLRFADTFLYFFPIALLSMSVSSGFRRLGDWAGGTLVVYTHTASFPKNITNLLAKYPVISPPNQLSYDEKQAILSFARRYPLLGESRANEIAGIYAPYLRDDSSGLSNAAYLLGIARHLAGEVSLAKDALLPKESL